MGGVVIGFSGGVDSTLLMKVAVDVLGDRAVAVIAVSSTLPQRELEEARRLAEHIGARSRIVHTREDANPKFLSNPPDRCYFCKIELFSKLREIAGEEDLPFIADGSNKDDDGDFRPGMKAGAEFGVRSPLREADLNKDEIRSLSRMLGLPTHDKPSFACLSSRFPYGTPITPEKLRMVDEAESFIRRLGFRTVRVRHYGATARIELDPEEMPRILDSTVRDMLINQFKELGYQYITVDLEGYRTGSMNRVLFDGSYDKSESRSGTHDRG